MRKKDKEDAGNLTKQSLDEQSCANELLESQEFSRRPLLLTRRPPRRLLPTTTVTGGKEERNDGRKEKRKLPRKKNKKLNSSKETGKLSSPHLGRAGQRRTGVALKAVLSHSLDSCLGFSVTAPWSNLRERLARVQNNFPHCFVLGFRC